MVGSTKRGLHERAQRWLGLAAALVAAVCAAAAVTWVIPTPAYAQGDEGQEGDAEAQATETSGEGGDAEDGEQDAREHFELGRELYEAGRFTEAAQEFETAYQISDRPELLYNIFLARRDAGNIGGAIDALERYLELVDDIDNRSALEARLRTMRRLRDQRGDGGEVEDGEGATGGDGEPADEPDEQTGDGGASEPTPPPAPHTEDTSPSALPWTVAGVGGALLVGSVVTGVLSLKKESDLESRCERVAEDTYACEPGFEDDKSKGAALATATDVLVASGLAFVGAGLALFFLLDDGGASESTSASVGCDGHGCAGSVRVSF